MSKRSEVNLAMQDHLQHLRPILMVEGRDAYNEFKEQDSKCPEVYHFSMLFSRYHFR